MHARTSRSTRSGDVRGEPHPDHPAEREAAEREAVEPGRVRRRKRRLREALDRPRPDGLLAVPGVVVPDQRRTASRAARRSAPTPRASSRATDERRSGGLTPGGVAASARSTNADGGAEVVLRRHAGAALGGGLGAEVRPHPLGVDLEPLERRPARGTPPRPSARAASHSGSHSACHAPAARSCSCSPPERRREGVDAEGARAREHGADRVPLVRHRRRAAAGNAHLPDLRLREQEDVEGDLRARGRDAVERGHELPHGRPRRVPGDVGLRRGRARPRRPAARRARASPSSASVPAAPPSEATGRQATRRASAEHRPRRATRPPSARTSSAPPAASASAPA